jgi:hypothetical protein
MGGLSSRLPVNQPNTTEERRDHIADAWRVPRERLKHAALPNPGMVVGMMERGLKDELLACFDVHVTSTCRT